MQSHVFTLTGILELKENLQQVLGKKFTPRINCLHFKDKKQSDPQGKFSHNFSVR